MSVINVVPTFYELSFHSIAGIIKFHDAGEYKKIIIDHDLNVMFVDI